jgi:alpha-glucosidase
VPNHSSDENEWFQKSAKRIEPYTDFYVWHDGKIDAETGKRVEPNNWVSFSPIKQNFFEINGSVDIS